ncbi:uncharacterized protein LOC143849352 [Tasmannia lanceolata]|uniref:uncharacterized protein LOC143849352 n=1 Tax=Tasmannia lanceolata TaxID=3420 RepID=UPI004062DE8B
MCSPLNLGARDIWVEASNLRIHHKRILSEVTSSSSPLRITYLRNHGKKLRQQTCKMQPDQQNTIPIQEPSQDSAKLPELHPDWTSDGVPRGVELQKGLVNTFNYQGTRTSMHTHIDTYKEKQVHMDYPD